MTEDKIKYDYSCKYYFGIITAISEETAKQQLKEGHTHTKKIKEDCQKGCKLRLKKA
jgi:hypothetical protein